MKIAVLGAGFAGLTAAYKLAKKGHQIVVFEKEAKPGGLARGFKLPGWTWCLDENYHHLFASDTKAFELIKELGLSDKLFFKKPVTGVYYKKRKAQSAKRKTIPTKSRILDKVGTAKNLKVKGEDSSTYPLDTPLNFLLFPHLSPFDKIRSGFALAYLKATPFWQHLEKIPAKDWIIKTMGPRVWQVLWEPLFINKFGQEDAAKVPASWFWARIKKRSQKLGYLEGGFQALAERLVIEIKRLGGQVYLNHEIKKITFTEDKKLSLQLKTGVTHCHPEPFVRHSDPDVTSGEESQGKLREELALSLSKGSHWDSSAFSLRMTPDCVSPVKNLTGDRHTNFDFDKVIVALATPIFLRITKSLFQNHKCHSEFSSESQIPKTDPSIRQDRVRNDSKYVTSDYIKRLSSIKHLNALTLVLELKKAFLKSDVYWLNICDSSFPFLLLVEHTNFIDPCHYGNQHLLYIGNYLPDAHPYFAKSKEELFKIFLPHLAKINPAFNFELCTLNFELFISPFAQPVFPLHYSQLIPGLLTPLPHLFLANQDQIYPWDRGVNYAIELGKKVANLVEVY